MQLESVRAPSRVTSGRASAQLNDHDERDKNNHLLERAHRRMPSAAACLAVGLPLRRDDDAPLPATSVGSRLGTSCERTGNEQLSSDEQTENDDTTRAEQTAATLTDREINTKRTRRLRADNNANRDRCRGGPSRRSRRRESTNCGPITLKPVPLFLSLLALLLSSQQTSQQQQASAPLALAGSDIDIGTNAGFNVATGRDVSLATAAGASSSSSFPSTATDSDTRRGQTAASARSNQTTSLQEIRDQPDELVVDIQSKLTGHLRFEFQRYDGWYNNLANSDWGTPNTRLRRKAAPAYSDGVYQMSDEARPSARLLSQRMMRGEDGLASRRNLTTLFAFFGQVISSEILMASESGCPIEMHRIKIERCDPMYDRECRGGRTMPFYRAAYDPSTGQSPNLPREQLNRVTSWIDGSFIYSTSETWLNTMRSFDGRGTLKMAPRPQQEGTASSSSSSSAVLGDAYLSDLVEALIREGGQQQQQLRNQDGSQKPPVATTTSVNLKDVPMSLFGYPMRNKQRAPLINHMPAHHLQMKKAERMFLLGDPRTNQNPMLLSFGILFYRWHNVLAERIHRQHPDWSDEEIFQRARRLVIASLQNIFLYEYLPVLLDTPPPPPPASATTSERRAAISASTSSSNVTTSNASATTSELTSIESLYVNGQNLNDLQYDRHDLIKPYAGYKPDLHPGISHAFQSSAFRFGHTMIPPGLYLRDDKCRFLKTAQGFKGVRLCSTWWNAEEVVSKAGIEQLLMGAASQIAEREDSVLCNDVRDKLYGPLDFSRRDLAALNIMRGRDNGLADYNTIRQAYRLPRITKWRDINPTLYDQQPGLFEELAKLYENRLDQVDLYIGGMLESDLERGRPGPLFRRIIKEQFERLRDSDRFWFENTDSGIFSEAEIEEIRQIKLYDIIVNSTLIPDDAIQHDVFQFKVRDPCPQPGQLSSKELQPCYIVKGHSYFKGNERTYMLVCLTLVAIPIVCALAAYLIVEHQDRKRRQFKAKQEYERNMLANSRSANQHQSGPHKGGDVGGGHTNKSYEHDSEEDELTDENDDDDDDELDDRLHEKRVGKTSSRKASVAPKCEKIYAKEWLHSNLKRKIKLRFGPEPDETVYVLDGKGQVQRKLDLNQAGSSSVVVELSTSIGAAPFGQAYSLISAPPKHPLQASPTTSSLSLASGGANSTLSVGSHQQLTARRASHHQPEDSTNGRADFASHHLESVHESALLAGSQLQTHTRPLTADDLDRPVDHKPMVLIRVARNYDLVLQFASTQHRRKFIFKFQAYLAKINKSMTLYQVQRDIMLANAETKEKRKQRLEQFFREAYALTFGLTGGEPNGSAATPHNGAHGATTNQEQQTPEVAKVSPDISMVMRTSLSRQEFAEALGMRSDSLFVRQMFNCIDKDRNGQISFQEFLDLVVKFSRGKPDDKLRIVFDMCDHSGRGLIEKRDLIRMLRSLVDMAKTKSLSEQQVLEMIEGMFEAVGLDRKPLLDYEDFKLIINSQLNVRDTLTSPARKSEGALVDAANADKLGNQQQQRQQPGEDKLGGHLVADYRQGHQLLPIGLDMKGAKRNFFTESSTQQSMADDYKLMSDTATTPAQLHHVRRMTIVDTGATVKQAAALSQARRRQHQNGLLTRLSSHWKALATELEEHRQDIVYLLMFYVIVVVLFLERFISYSFLSEHMDLRHVMGFGIAITRGSAASLSFCYAMLLLSMCRNLMTWIRNMSVREYIPLDSHVKFHKIVAMTALVMTILHTVGHCVNFYHVTQQPVEHLRCLTKEMQFSGESRPTFFYWVFQTVTGTTGLLLWILCSIVYVFAHREVRQRAYSFFWSTHKLYYLIYALTLLHGSSKLTGSPRFWIFFIIPAILFTIDKIMSLQAKLWQLEIFETECLPSDVIAIKFARPPSFKFLSGQWIRVACTAFRPHEFHAFTITSAPQDDYLSVHVRAQGPWTWKLRNLFDPTNLEYQKMMARKRLGKAASSKLQLQQLHSKLPPRIRIEGPFGGGNQDWCKYEVAVMIGGGIGVTPYASILNDLVFGTSTSRYSSVNYKKVYFIWICPSHRNFEWFIDVLREVEKKDVTNLLEMHIFITQFFHKFDLRTTMLYICENHFQQISNRSLFTGLKAINHFGRPDIAAFLQQVQNKHSRVSKVGVFSCGPKPLTKSVTEACEKVNKRRKLPFFLHQYENFS